MKYLSLVGWLLVYIVLFGFLQYKNEYHFYLLEQNHLFENTWYYINEHIHEVGGFANLLGEFLVQFFLLPYAGPAIMACLLTLTGILTERIVKRISPESFMLPLCLLPPAALLFIFFNFNYLTVGTVAYIIAQLFLWGVLSISNDKYRIAGELILVPLLYFVAGSISVLFVTCITIYELCKKSHLKYGVFFTWIEIGLLALYSVKTGWFGEFRFVLLPDLYFHRKLQPDTVIYLSWISFIAVFALAILLKNRKEIKAKTKLLFVISQVVIIVALLFWGIPEYIDTKSYRAKKLDYYSRTGQWEEIKKECQGSLTNYLYLCYLNMALAETGELADKMFHYDQRGIRGVMVPWNKVANISILLNDIYFTMGDVPSSQQMAFEANVSTVGEGNPRVLKRLVQTNLIYGEYKVAEKYISILENTYCYKKWAKDHRRFLYNDQEVENDSLLRSKRLSIPDENYLSKTEGLEVDLMYIAEKNPDNKAAIEYVGAILLLAKDLPRFQQLLGKYYGTDVLPSLPVSFQEAIITLSENQPDYWKQFGIKSDIMDRFAVYKQQVLAHKNNPDALPGLLRKSFGDTYWYYFMFKQYD